MMSVTQMPMSVGNQPFAVYFGSSEGTPEGGSAGGGKRRGLPAKKTPAKPSGGNAPKKGPTKRK